MLTWAHIGDLHASSDDDYLGTARLAEWAAQARQQLRGAVDFVFVPGDNANNGLPAQYARIVDALDGLDIPIHAIPGDHDRESGHLNAFARMPGAGVLPRAVHADGRRCLFLDVVSAGGGGPDFRLGEAQLAWLADELDASRSDTHRPAVFMHAYPSDLAHEGEALGQLFAQAGVAMVDTGHTHYNEVLNDGRVIYASTRSLAQIEEDDGQPGFSIVTLDGCHVSWRFKRLASPWPFVTITAPADRRLDTGCTHVPEVRAKVFGRDIAIVTLAINGQAPQVMDQDEWNATVWSAPLGGFHAKSGAELVVTATDTRGNSHADRIEWLGTHGRARTMPDAPLGTDAHAVEAWPGHGLLGTQLGPNKHGRKW
ncbi:metallophosphoesterase [Luteibacter sp. CQ10]|uniref:metallophosphoesterase n=1 Tax=Luteibacter sp. CQ10 TaxID=2805821 RepID=UPI0034A18312